MRKDKISSLYRLSPLQEGMLFHSLYDRESLAYKEQLVADFPNGLALDAFKKSWKYVMANHSVLRTGFVYEELSTTIQFVYKTVELPLEVKDFSQLSDEIREENVAHFLEEDRRKGFDLGQPPLMRITLLKLGEKAYKMVWTFHHILIDGWSMPVVFGEWLTAYESCVKGKLPPARKPDLYKDYIDYIYSKDKFEEERFWKSYLEGVETPSLLAPPQTDAENEHVSTAATELGLLFDETFTSQLQAFAQANELTVNTIIQGVWSFLLSRYTGQSDVVFGATVSGRPTDLPGVEQKVGLYINTIPVRSTIEENESVVTTFQSMQKAHTAAREYQYTALSSIQGWQKMKGDLFDSILVFENYPTSEALQIKRDVEVANVHFKEQTNYALTLVAGMGQELGIKFSYYAELLSDAFMARLKKQFENVLRQIVKQANSRFSDLEILSTEEKEALLNRFDKSAVAFPKDKSIVDLFEAQVLKTPDKTALVFEEKTLSYTSLNKKANQLAHFLRTQNIGRESKVAICLSPALDMTIGLLGILKAGGAYVPIDPDYPQDRIDFVLQDIDATIVLVDEASSSLFQNTKNQTVIRLDEEQARFENQPETNPNWAILPEDLAYIIYTSGSTGRPKGVLIPHQNVVRLFQTDAPLFDFEASDVWTQFHSFCFDFTIWEMYGALLFGGKLILVSKEMARNTPAFADLLIREKVSVLNQTPTAFYNLQEQLLLSQPQLHLRYVIFGGEALNPSRLRAWHSTYPATQLINMYGITETTVHVTYKEIGKEEIEKGISNIGHPIPTLSCYVLDKNKQLLPIGAAGELYVGGAGVARGYLQLPTLTEERFIPNPFSQQADARLYKTGDLVKYLPDGNLEYLGRIDEQVKIRGYRIELGEIETVLEQSDLVRQCVVVAKEDEQDKKRLIAYVVAENVFDKVVIREHLTARLPDYMVPNLLIELETIPLTSNGKLDRKALPNPDLSNLLLHQFMAPRNETEIQLANIWKELLKLDQVGIHDNFFELGGDSIISIQVVSRAKRKGLAISPRDLFQHQTIAALSANIKDQAGVNQAEQGQLSGEAGLLPIQQWFLEKDYDKKSHYNQALLLRVNKEQDIAQLEAALRAVVDQHDALHFVYREEEAGRWMQEYGRVQTNLKLVDLSASATGEWADELSTVCQTNQATLSIEQGELLKAVFIKTPESESHHRLFIAIHHLAIDGVSWRILMDHLQAALGALAREEVIELGLKTSSYRQWQQSLTAHATRPRFEGQLAYWQAVADSYQTLPVDRKSSSPSIANDVESYSMKLDVSLTKALLTEVHHAYHTEINDLLLSALVKTITDWTGGNKMVLGLEGHGREALNDAIDLTETVGWFTSLYPLALEVKDEADSGRLIQAVKEQLRAIPNKGIGFGMLRYLHPKAEIRESLSGNRWDIVFNYLGQLDNALSSSDYFSPASEAAGQSVANSFPYSNKLEINSMVTDGELSVSWRYSRKEYDASTMIQLANNFGKNLTELIQHCQAQKEAHPTPSDFGLTSLIQQAELDAFLETEEAGLARKERIRNLYPLSPTQEGLLFHGLYDPNSNAYKVQLIVDFPEGLHLEAFRSAWNDVLEKRSILRSGFFYDELSTPVQAVYKSLEMPFEVLDLSDLSAMNQEVKWQAFLDEDRRKAFDFQRPPLMRITLAKFGDNHFQMAWTSHHILFDGWSKPLMIKDLLIAYEACLHGKTPPQKAEDKYRDFIDYLGRKDPFEETQFWTNYLDGLEQPSLLPFVQDDANRNKGGERSKEADLLLDAPLTEKLQAYAKKHHLTVNTIIQGVWSFLLSKYTGNEDVVFGVTVSGRPTDLEGAEQRVGLFINSIPVRATIQQDQKLVKWLGELQQSHTQAREFQHTPLSQIHKWVDVQGDLFDSILVFENYPLGDVFSTEWSLKAEVLQAREASNYLLTVTVLLGEELKINFNYNGDLLETQSIDLIKGHIESMIRQIVDRPGIKCSQIEMLTAIEKQQLLVDFNDTAVAYPPESTILELLVDQAIKTPDQPAVIFEDRQLTYKELNALTDRLAVYLRTNSGIGREDRVGILCQRSERQLIAMLGILKAGGAYVPIDPAYPKERIEFIRKDAGLKTLLLDSAFLFELEGFEGDLFAMDIQLDTLPALTEALPLVNELNDLAYVLYTSGSTGQPKGVMIEHHSLKNYLLTAQHSMSDPEGTAAGSFIHFPITFDASLTALFVPLLTGKFIVIGAKESLEVFTDDNFLKYAPYDFLKLTPAHLQVLQSQIPATALAGLTKKYVIGGEALKKKDIQFLIDQAIDATIINEYGPTEATVGCVTYAFHTQDEIRTSPGGLIIGHPSPNVQTYILDNNQQAVPIGVAGELCLGGIQLARAYMNLPALSAEKFIPHPFQSEAGARLYRSGDRARWLADGQLEFLGRIDEQLKIKGYRIEAGEIESILLQSGQLTQCAVMAREDEKGNKRLAAYLVLKESVDPQNIRTYATNHLPDYMVPSLWMEMDRLPLTKNGKVDKKNLPDPQSASLHTETYVPPSNETEAELAAIWADLLSVEKVGIHDNFFELGGDSIITIQVVSRAKRKGYALNPYDVFQYPSVAALAKAIKEQQSVNQAEQGQLSGVAPLLPIQHWYLDKTYSAPSHFNQALLLEVDKELEMTELSQCLEAVIRQHDALNVVFRKEEGRWLQEYRPYVRTLEVLDLSQAKTEELSDAIQRLCQAQQESLDIEQGVLIKTVLMKTPPDHKDRLLIVIHHLVVDGVSWRILLEHLGIAMEAVQAGEAIDLGRKTASVRQWGEALAAYASGPQLEAQQAHWMAMADQYKPLPVEREVLQTVNADISSCSVQLNEKLTKALLQKANKAYHTEINDLLICALLLTMKEWTGEEQLVIGMEGHGREDLGLGLDLTETVGWFTNIYPLALEAESGLSKGGLIKSVKEQLRGNPEKGMGFGILRYLHPSESLRERMAQVRWDIVFNYLGQMDNVIQTDQLFQAASESVGKNVAGNYPVDDKLVINSSVSNGALQLSWNYSQKEFSEATINRLANQYVQQLSDLVEHCLLKRDSEYTPADYGLNGDVNFRELEHFLNARENGRARKEQIETVCRLSPIQEGMLFHAMYDLDSKAYIVQLIADFEEGLNVDAFLASWKWVVKNHSVFRSSIYHDALSIPVQCIYKEVEMPFQLIDLSQLSEEERAEQLDEYLVADHKKKFDFSVAPLMRMSLFKLGANNYKMAWTSHHIIADGWSKPILFEEVLSAYEYYGKGQEPPARKEDRYEDFIRYINARDEFKEKEFWNNYLKDFEGPTLLPFTQLTYGRNSGTGISKELDLNFDRTFTERLHNYAKQHHLTVNTIFQGVWFILLSRYTASSDVVCGVTVSGRPADLEGIEERIGLFIHTLPIRAKLSKAQSVIDWLSDIHREHTQAREYQYTPLSTIQSWEGIQGDLFDSVLVFENYPQGTGIAEDRLLQASNPQTVEHTNYMLTLLALVGEELAIRFSYNSSILPDISVQMIKGHFQKVLEQLLDEPDLRLSEMNVLSSAERQQLLVDFNEVPNEFEIDKTIADLFEEQVARTPENAALQFEGTQWTYQVLNESANRLAHYLIDECAVKSGDLVPLLCLREESMIIAILAVFKAGAAYVPINPEFPDERIAQVLTDMKARLVLTTSGYVDLCDRLQWEVAGLDRYVCVDNKRLPAFDVMEAESKSLWNYVADKSENAIDASGWVSSYTNELFGEAEMQELVDNVIAKVAPYIGPDKRVLEVGCGSGLILFDLVDQVKHYSGTDISDRVLDQVQVQLDEKGISHVDLHSLSANEIDQLAGQKYDVIIINSVVQHFKSLRYMRDFLDKAMALLSDDGVLFIGDVRDKELQDDFYRSLFKDEEHLDFLVKEKRQKDPELFFHKDFYQDFFNTVSVKSELAISGKQGTIENELSLYRYDVLVRLFKNEPASARATIGKQQLTRFPAHEQAIHNPSTQRDLANPAYVIFTSGSTGQPKGVVIPHSALSNFLLSMKIAPGMEATDSVLSVSAYTFDISVLDFLLPLVAGAKLILTPSETALDPVQIRQLFEKEKPTFMQAVPTYWRMLVECGWKGSSELKVLSGGEPITGYLIEELLLRSREYWNCYGPTETTIYCSHSRISGLENGIQVGRPMHNTSYYLLDADLELVPVGVPGEIYIGGDLLALGYLGNPELTDRLFIENPHRKGERIYKSGDMGKWRSDGRVEILGRVDNQLKIRGFRMEAEEIEQLLQGHPDISIAVVNAWKGEEQKELVAYLVAKEERPIPDASYLRAMLSESLPDYMIPAYFVEMDQLPQTARGKIDRKALPDPTAQRIATGANYQAARNETEAQLANIWASVLKLERVGMQDNFFDLGGHSLLAVRLMAKINKTFGIELPISLLFACPTIDLLAKKLMDGSGEAAEQVLLELNKGGEQAPLFCAPGAGGNAMTFYPLAKLLDGAQRVYAFQAPGIDGKTDPLEKVEDMASLFIDELLKVDPVGPYHLAGYSFGGKVVYEMALQLRSRGLSVAQIIIFDTGAPAQTIPLPGSKSSETYAEKLLVIAEIISGFYNKKVPLKLTDLAHQSKEAQLFTLYTKASEAGIDLTFQQVKGFANVYLTNISAVYVPGPKEPLEVPFLFFKSSEIEEAQAQITDMTFTEDRGWEALSNQPLIMHTIDAGHLDILNQPHVEKIVAEMKKAMPLVKDGLNSFS